MTVEQELDRLAREHGHITPELVVEAARDEGSPLHSHFDWDDSAAADKWRREQARQLIIRCRITVEVKPDQSLTVRRYTGVPRPEGRAVDYVPTERALTSKRELVLESARVELESLRRKYESLIDFDSLLRDTLEGEDTAA